MPVPVHIVLHQGRIVAVDGGRGVIQRRQKIFLDIADIGGVVLHTVHDILNMGTVQLHKPGLCHLRRIIVSGNAEKHECVNWRTNFVVSNVSVMC